MSDRAFLFLEGRQVGPFDQDEILELIDDGKVRYEDLCLPLGATSAMRLSRFLDWDETEHLEGEGESEGDPDDEDNEEAEAESESDDDDWEDDEEVEGGLDKDEDLEEDDDDDEIDATDEPELELPKPEPRVPLPLTEPGRLLYVGRPSVLRYPKSCLLVAASLAGALVGAGYGLAYLLGGLVLALVVFTSVLVQRSLRLYTVTPSRVEIIYGFVAKNSNEVRVEDIRAINVRKSGFQGWIGVGTVEFASAGSDTVEVSFEDIRGADRVKKLVRRLQDLKDGG